MATKDPKKDPSESHPGRFPFSPGSRDSATDRRTPSSHDSRAGLPPSAPISPVSLTKRLSTHEAALPPLTTPLPPLDPPRHDNESGTGPAGPMFSQSSVAVPMLSASQREERLTCSFPGLLKVLFPEKSFIPTPLAVRVVNLSSGGAMVEIHDRAKIEADMHLANRFFELKVAHPEVPLLRGSIAWSDMSRENPFAGLQLFERNAAISQVLLLSETGANFKGPPPLPSPVIDPLPPLVRGNEVVITGLAPEALEIHVKTDEAKFSAKVIKERFQIPIKLPEGEEHQISLRSQAGQRKSRTIPILIACELEASKRRFHFDAILRQDPKSLEHQVKLEFAGSVRQAERILYRFSQLMAIGDTVKLDIVLGSVASFDKRLFETLRGEGALLAADSDKNEAAARLLDDLL